MEKLEDIYTRAVIRHDGEDAVEDSLPSPRSRRSLIATKDALCLSTMAKCIFRSGFVWRVVEAKWSGFEIAFDAFEPHQVRRYTQARLAKLGTDERIIRNKTKIASVVANAEFIADTSEEHGSFGKFIAKWPADDVVGLWLHMRQHGSRLGGNTGPMVLRTLGRDTFMLSNDVVKYLIQHGIVSKNPTGKGDLYRVQEAFNTWSEESGGPLGQGCRNVAMSQGEVYDHL